MIKLKQNRAITLIALIITIIVLLILASVTITTLTGENGLLNRAAQSSEKSIISTAKEEIELAIMEEQIRVETEENIGDKFNYENVWKSLNITETRYDTTEKCYYITYKGYEFKIDENKEVTYVGEDDDKEENYAKKWLENASLDSKYNYNTLDEILEDMNCLNELMNNINSVDYMISKTGTIMPKLLNSRDGMECLAKSKYASYKAVVNDIWYENILKSQYEEVFLAEMQREPIVQETSKIQEHIYSTDQEDVYLYSEGKSESMSYTGSDITYLPLMFDDNNETAWLSRSENTQYFPGRVGIHLENEAVLYKVQLNIKEGNLFSSGICIQDSKNLSEWNKISEDILVNEGTYTITTTKRTDANTFVIYIPSKDSGNSAEIYELTFYYIDKPVIMTVNEEMQQWLKTVNVNVSENQIININQYIESLMNSRDAINYMVQNNEIMDIALSNKKIMQEILNSDYAKYKIVTTADAYNKISSSEYIETFDNSNSVIPTITQVNSTSTTGIYSTNNEEISLYSHSDNGDPAFNNAPEANLVRLFDNNDSTSWNSRTTGTTYFPARIGAIFSEKMICYKVEATIKNTSKLPSGFCIQGSNDLSTWSDLSDYITTDGTIQIGVNELKEYTTFVTYIPSINSNSLSFQIYDMKFYCVQKVE